MLTCFVRCSLLIAICVLAAGCQPLGIHLSPDAQMLDKLAQMRFPDHAALGSDLDILVLRDRADIVLVNRTPNAYRDHYLWLNCQYVARINTVKIGTGNRFNLTQFINEHRESFPIGAFLAPDKARPLISADLINASTGERHRLTVRFGAS